MCELQLLARLEELVLVHRRGLAASGQDAGEHNDRKQSGNDFSVHTIYPLVVLIRILSQNQISLTCSLLLKYYHFCARRCYLYARKMVV